MGSETRSINGVGDAVSMVVDYLKQETIAPLRGLGRYVGFGLAASVFLSIGLSLLMLSGLRALQTETGTTFQGNLSWAPYLIVLFCAVVIAGIAAAAIGRSKRNMKKSKGARK